jgi:hypothetical protein
MFPFSLFFVGRTRVTGLGIYIKTIVIIMANAKKKEVRIFDLLERVQLVDCRQIEREI